MGNRLTFRLAGSCGSSNQAGNFWRRASGDPGRGKIRGESPNTAKGERLVFCRHQCHGLAGMQTLVRNGVVTMPIGSRVGIISWESRLMAGVARATGQTFLSGMRLTNCQEIIRNETEGSSRATSCRSRRFPLALRHDCSFLIPPSACDSPETHPPSFR